MLFGEHEKERVSERFQRFTNQPKQRGYIPGCHLRTGGGVACGGYQVGVLMGNWNEERWDNKFVPHQPAVAADLQNTWTTTYRQQTSAVHTASHTFAEAGGQIGLVDVVDGRHRSFPGHQPETDPHGHDGSTQLATETRSSFINPRQKSDKLRLPYVMPGAPNARSNAVIQQIKKKVLQQRKGNFTDLRRCLRRFDFSHSGLLNEKELLQGLTAYGIESSMPEAKAIFSQLDPDGHGEISIEEFVRTIRGEMNETRRVLVAKAYKIIDRVCDGIVRLRDLLRLFDAEHQPDVMKGNSTADAATKAFRSLWDKKESDVVSLEDFIEYYNDVSANIDATHYFELIIRNTWHMSGGEGPAANTSCRRVLVTHTNGRQTVEEIKNDLGMPADRTDLMIENLHEQGIKDIARIEPVRK